MKDFIQLLSPRPTGRIYKLPFSLPKGVRYTTDEAGNYYVKIGKDVKSSSGYSRVAFTAHLDTVESPRTLAKKIVVDPKTLTVSAVSGGHPVVLGADDAAGLWLIKKMIEAHVPGLYCIFQNEESGRTGSEYAAVAMERGMTTLFDSVGLMISLDRKGTRDIIMTQMGNQCISFKMLEELKFQLAPLGRFSGGHGSYTDSASFMGLIPECTNISVGYHNQHTTEESQDFEYLTKLLKVLKSLDQKALLDSVELATWGGNGYYYMV